MSESTATVRIQNTREIDRLRGAVSVSDSATRLGRYLFGMTDGNSKRSVHFRKMPGFQGKAGLVAVQYDVPNDKWPSSSCTLKGIATKPVLFQGSLLAITRYSHEEEGPEYARFVELPMPENDSTIDISSFINPLHIFAVAQTCGFTAKPDGRPFKSRELDAMRLPLAAIADASGRGRLQF